MRTVTAPVGLQIVNISILEENFQKTCTNLIAATRSYILFVLLWFAFRYRRTDMVQVNATRVYGVERMND